MLFELALGRHRAGPRTIGQVGVRRDRVVCRDARAVGQLEIDVAVGDVIADLHFGHWVGRRRHSRTREVAVVTGGAKHPEVIGAAVGAEVPITGELFAGLHRIATRNLVEVLAIVDMEHRGRAAGIAEGQPNRGGR